MKLRKRIFTLFTSILLVFTLAACGNNNEYSFGTGNIGGNYYSYGNALAGIIENDGNVINVKTTQGSAANLRLLQNGFLDMAIVQSDVLLDACNGTGAFEGKACSGVRAIAGLYTEECQIVVNADSEIYDVEDLYNKKVSVGEEESGVMKNAEQILLANGLNFNRVNVVNLSFADSAQSLKKGEIDAFFCTAGAPTTSILELSKEMNIRIISLNDRTIEQLINEYPCYTRCVIPKGTYQGQDEDVTTLGVKAVLVVTDKVTDEFVKYITETLFTHSSELMYATPAGELTSEFATSAIPAPFHKGAALWYEENNITVNTNADGTSSFGITVNEN